jgi:myosin heavy subunit
MLFQFQKKTYPSAEVGQVNPPKFEKCDDMVNLTYLNDASVFHNLEGRYKAKLIHTCKLTVTPLKSLSFCQGKPKINLLFM